LGALVSVGSAAVAHAAPGESEQAQGEHAHRGHHGRERHGDLVHAALRLDSLGDAQRQQIEGLIAQEKGVHANVRVARSQLLEAVAAGVAAGNVDDIALSPNVKAVESAIQADEPAERATLERLHAILTPAQRVELVGRLESHAGPRGPRESLREDAGAQTEHRGPRPFARELNLTDAQRAQIATNLRSIGPATDRSAWKGAHETERHVLEAFKGDRFVMNEVAPPRDPRLVEQEAMRVVRMAKASAPVLTVTQRSTAATELRTRAAHESSETK
jgi:Spy/CpxP family protein refolding chaperone